MPTPSTPLTFECPTCGWQKTTTPDSGVLRQDDFYTCCSHCGNRDLLVQKATPWAAWLARFHKRWTLWQLSRKKRSAVGNAEPPKRRSAEAQRKPEYFS